jgi:RNA polymerase sigma factor (sigma-70 family)
MLRKGEMQGDLPYLYRAVTNRCLNHLRDGSNRRRLEVENAEALRGPARTTLDGIAIGKELLLRLVGRLDERSAEVLVCVFYDDMTQEETAAHLGVSRKTVQKRLDGIRAEVARLAEAK